MSIVQHILVCAQDSVLAKKVRFLLARDECEVEIINKPSQLERRLREDGVALLILSRILDGEDAIELLARFDAGLVIPPTIVLGGQPAPAAEFITVIPDPIDTQAIYRIASEALAVQAIDAEESEGSEEDDGTSLSLEHPQNPTQPVSYPPSSGIGRGPTSIDTAPRSQDDDVNFTDVTGLDEIAGRLDLLESAGTMRNDGLDVDDPKPVPPSASGPRPRALGAGRHEPPVLGGLLEPARFAKVLYQCWSKQATGALIVARDHETLTIHFENGGPVYVESSIPGDPLGRSLVSRGRITEAQYSDAAKRAIERGLRLGQALIELAFFTTQELGRELGTSAREQIVGCFAARTGAFEFDMKRKIPTDERPYSIQVGHVLAEGIKRHCDEGILKEIIGDSDGRYFKLSRSIEELQKRFPLDPKEISFLDFSGRAYNGMDASDVSGLDMLSAHKLMALLTTCEEVQDFTPGVREFEARIAEERQRSRDLAAKSRSEEIKLPRPEPAKREEPSRRLEELPRSQERRLFPPMSPDRGPDEALVPVNLRKIPTSSGYATSPPLPGTPAPPPLPAAMPIGTSSAASSPPAASNGDAAVVPPMPVPPNGEGGMVPRPLVYAKPALRGLDGNPLETQERTLSREHFQRGVTLLGQGNFASAEEAFRDAVALCSEEHVYLIGLARAIYYNPGYRADGKVPVLKAIVGRAEQLAPDDNRVATLSSWIQNAESQLKYSLQA